MEDSNNAASTDLGSTDLGSADLGSTECKLLNSALALFSEKGYRGACIREIIERAGVTRPVLYYYFKNKEDLFCRLVESSFAELGEDLVRIIAAPGTCRAKLKSLMSKTFVRAEESPEMVRLLLQAVFSNGGDGLRLDAKRLVEQRLERVAVIVREGLDSGELTGGDGPALALAFVGLMDMHIMIKVHRPQAVLTPQLADYLVDLFFNGAAAATAAAAPEPEPLHSVASRTTGYCGSPDRRQNRVAET